MLETTMSFGALYHVTNGCYGRTKVARDCCSRIAIFDHLKRKDMVYLSEGVTFTETPIAIFISVLDVLCGRDPFKIRDRVVSSVGIFMIDLLSWLRRADKSGSYQAMNSNIVDMLQMAKRYISITVYKALGDYSWCMSHVASIADFVKPVPRCNGDWPPLFLCHLNTPYDSFIERV